MQKITMRELILTAILAGCSKDHTPVEIKITAKASDGKPVSGAAVILDGESVAETNAFGEAKVNASLRTGKFHKLTLTKEDPHYYYAPHIEVFKAKQISHQSLDIAPTMYLVPKPRYKPSDNAPNVVSTGPAKLANEAIKSTPTPWPPLVEQPFVQNEETRNPLDASPSRQLFMTGHVYAGRLPLADARITWSNAGTIISCITNERGRCVLKVPDIGKEEASILVEKKDYQSQMLVTTSRDGDNLRFSLQLGSKIAIRVTQQTPWSSRPLAGVEVRLSGASRGTTNADGLALVEIGAKSSGSIELADPQSGENLSIPVKDISSMDAINIHFSDAKQLGWRRKVLLPIYGTSSVKGMEPTHFSQPMLAEALNLAPTNGRSQGSDAKQNRGLLEILPIVHHNHSQYQIIFQAILQQDVIAQSNPIPVTSTDLKSSWTLAATRAYKDLNDKIIAPAIVTKASNHELWLKSAGNIPKNGTVIDLVPNGIVLQEKSRLQAKVTSASEGVLRATVLQNSHDDIKIHPWQLIGAVAMPAEGLINAPSTITFNDLTRLNTPDRSILLARKYLAENNMSEALKVLEQNSANLGDVRSRRKMRSDIYLTMGDMTSVLREQVLMMKDAVEQGQPSAASVSEANILRIQAQNSPVIVNESSLADALSYVISRTESLLAEAKNSSPELMLSLQYTKLLATRKKAECEDDLVALAALSSDLNRLETLLDQMNGTTDLRKSWRPLLDAEKSKISMSTAADAATF
jgi:hypothetical protein